MNSTPCGVRGLKQTNMDEERVTVTDVDELMAKLVNGSRGCEDRFIDLKTLKYHAAPGEMKLYNDNETYHFKSDPKNPRDPKITHAARQFCKIIGVPFSFLLKNPAALKKDLVECWKGTLKTESSSRLGKVRVAKGMTFMRAFLPVEYTNISNVDVMESVVDAIGDDFKIQFVFGDEPDDLILHVRFICKDSFQACGEQCSYGFSVIASELGAGPLSVDTMLFRHESGSALLASYGGSESFFTSEYEKVQANELKNLFPQMIDHLKGQLHQIREKVQSAKELAKKKADVLELLKDLRLRRGLSDRFHRLMAQEVDSDESIDNRWEFSNRVAMLARDFEVKTRLKIERVAGDLVGLGFEKN